ncbi:MAG: hypothetical protein RIT43_1551 [Bacteroidota bacterium]
MSRLHLILFLVLCWPLNKTFGQNNLGAYLKHAQEKFESGDYFYAAELYQKAMAIDSNSVATLWNYAETLRAYKDYRKAEYYYKKVYDREAGGIYPYSLLYYGLMQKQNGNYDAALETFKKVKSKFSKDKKGYIYLKAKRELESCLWARSARSDSAKVVFEHLPEIINSKDSEFGHAFAEGKLLFSSLRADSVSSSEEVYAKSYKTRLYSSEQKDSTFSVPKVLKEFVFSEMNSGNGTFSRDRSRFYFSQCSDGGASYKCKIMVATYASGRISRIDSLGTIINAPGKNTTMPCLTYLNGDEVLFFASDREGGQGGMDLWYSIIRNGTQFMKPVNLKGLNSVDNELSPWFDTLNQTLYFASSWHNGFGGYDIFASTFKEQFAEPQNIGQPFNSPANDLYYFKHADTAYVSSNRIGVNYSKNPTCCSDIFSGYPVPPPPPIPVDSVPTPKKETLAELSKRLPVTLYFHNDCPDPKSRDTLTHVNYINGYNDYRALLEKYQMEYSSGLDPVKAEEAKEDIESFFIEYVDQGVKDLQLFRDLLLEELHNGSRINLTVKGFASPLAKTDYNVNLTKRRISSLVNYLREYENGVFVPYIDGTAKNGGMVQFTEVPFGEYTANKLTSDNFHDQKNSVYSRAAAIERKIEIQSVDFMKEDSLLSLIQLSQTTLDLKQLKPDSIVEQQLILRNISSRHLFLRSATCDDSLFSISFPETLQPGQEIVLTYKSTKPLPTGLFFVNSKIFFVGFKDPVVVPILGEGKP